MYVLLVKWNPSRQLVRAAAAESRHAESSASGPSSSSPTVVDSSESERDDSQKPCQEVVVSLLSKLRSPRPSDFVRKWEHNGHFLQNNQYNS